MPSEKYSSSGLPLMFTNGSTAMDLGSTLGAAARGGAVAGVAGSPLRNVGCP
jgi:hypothetical protein